MDVLWLLVIVPVSFIAGFFLAAILASSHVSEAESFWRNQYFELKDRDRREVL
jgi:ABC-type sugar transport system permease subunit